MMLRCALFFALCLGVSGTTCGDLKTFYKNSNCCGDPAKTVTGALNCGSTVTLAMVTAAQKSWGDGIIAIAKSYTDGGDYEQVARDHINNLYGYAQGDVLFKPTLAANEQFRGTFDGAVSYFVAKNTQAPSTVISEDSGFAIKGWTAVRFENTEVITSGSTAMAMGNYFFTNSAGATKVEYTFGYFLDAAGNLRINLHKSALPYVPPV
jgi:hypothetical protein